MSSALSPGSDRHHIATTQDGLSQTTSSLWSTDEFLFTHLQAELALAVASLPIASALPISGSITYQNFGQFFEEVARGSPEGASECTTGIIPKSEIDYCSKEEELVGSVRWKTQNLVIKARHAGGIKRLKWWTVTPKVFNEYREIYRIIGHNTEVDNPKDHPTIWAFLNRIVREEFLDSCTSNVGGGEEGEQTEDDMDEYYDEEEKNGEEEEGQPTKTRFKSASKSKRGSGHSANRTQNNFLRR